MHLGLKRKKKYVSAALKYANTVIRIPDNSDLTVLLLCHALEKGMGIPDVKRGYGKEKTERLISLLQQMKEKGRTDTYVFRESLTILKAYFAYQESEGVDVSALKERAAALLTNDSSPYQGGFRYIKKEELISGTDVDFEKLLHSRHSMRTYSQEKVSEEELRKVISLTKLAPSACNREPWKFYCSLDREKSQKIASAAPKQSFLGGIPYFGVVTVDKTLFASNEINQWYVNGGIFLGYLSLSFHHCGMGSCIFQYPVLSESASELRSTVGISENEEIIAIVGFGKYPDEAKCIYADRRPDNDILQIC